MKAVISLILVIFSGLQLAWAQNQVFSAGDKDSFEPFLYGEYQPNRPNVYIFKDPFCPYCIRAIDNLDNLSSFNVYIFWAPILGESSIGRVNDIFQCEDYAAQNVLEAVKERRSPNCSGAIDQNALDLNLEWVTNYNIYAVPSYFVEGRSTSYQALLRIANKKPKINGIALDWQRFELMQHTKPTQSKFLILRVPAQYTGNLNQLIEQYKPQYVFVPPAYAEENPEFLHCQLNSQDCVKSNSKLYARRSGEFELLFAQNLQPDKVLLVDYQGKMYKQSLSAE